MSQAKRTMLIKSVASSIPIYGMSSFLIPQSICTNIDSLIHKFRWGYKLDDEKHFSLHFWNKICSPKLNGGMGIKKMQELNFPLLSKLGWKMLSPDPKPWVKFLSAKYVKHSEFMHVERKISSSWIWKGILKSSSFLSQGRCFLVGSRETIRT